MEYFNSCWNLVIDQLMNSGKTSKRQHIKLLRRWLVSGAQKQVVNLPTVLANECESSRMARTELSKNTSNAKKREMYRDKNRPVKKAIRTHRRKQFEEKIQVMEEDLK